MTSASNWPRSTLSYFPMSLRCSPPRFASVCLNRSASPPIMTGTVGAEAGVEPACMWVTDVSGGSGGIRTHDLPGKSRLL